MKGVFHLLSVSLPILNLNVKFKKVEYRTGHHDPREITKFGHSPSLSCFLHQLQTSIT